MAHSEVVYGDHQNPDHGEHHHGQNDHPFHLVNPSPWPLASAMSLLLLTLGAAMSMHHKPFGTPMLIVGIAAIVACAFFWWRDVVKEGLIDRAHTPAVSLGLRVGMGLFIVSEVHVLRRLFSGLSSAAPSIPPCR